MPDEETSRPAGGVTTHARLGTNRFSAPGRYKVRAADYDLGATAFHQSWFHGFGTDGFPDASIKAPMELTASVYYPDDDSTARHPLVEIEHGLWQTCADPHVNAEQLSRAVAEVARSPVRPPINGVKQSPDARTARWLAIIDRAYPKLNGWPCRNGVPPIASYRGYAYLGRLLASYGMIVISIGENGVNSGDLYSSDRARAAVGNKHLAMWAQLDRTGGGPLKGRFMKPGTHEPVAVDFKNRIDLSRVGLVGHSRGGRGVMWQAADTHRRDLPSGVRIQAVALLAPAALPNTPLGDPAEKAYTTARIPVLGWIGTCDRAVGAGADDYLERMRGKTTADLVRIAVHGANHNFLNTQWSPEGGVVSAQDDATHPATQPKNCEEQISTTKPAEAVHQLTEQQEREIAAAYVGAFLREHLLKETGLTSLLMTRKTWFRATVLTTITPPTP